MDIFVLEYGNDWEYGSRYYLIFETLDDAKQRGYYIHKDYDYCVINKRRLSEPDYECEEFNFKPI